jgi:hypothetical protein
MSTIEVNTIKPISGSSTITLGESGDTIALASGASQTLAVNTPAFLAYVSSGQSFSNNTMTLVQFNTELYDTNSDYDNSSYVFTPTVAGKYFFTCKIRFEVGSISGFQIRIEKNSNTSDYTFPNVLYYNARVENYDTQILSGVLEANGSSDNFRVRASQDSGGAVNISATFGSFWSAHRIIGA